MSAAGAVTCAVCGTVAEGPAPPLGWSTSQDARGTSHLCPACSREHVRSIESKLDEAWWT